MCEKSCGGPVSLRSHEESHLKNEKQYHCDNCSFQTKKSSGLSSHKRRIHGKLDLGFYKCDQCNRTSTTRNGLELHIDAVHKGLKKFICDQCDFKAGYAGSVKKHVDVVHKKSRSQCTLCTWEGYNLVQHNKNVHGPKVTEKWKCDICDKEYSRKSHLKLHKDRAHFGIRYSCPNCKHRATTAANLKIHIKSKHEGVKIPCNLCDHQAYDKSSLSGHIKRVHNTFKAYQCNFCDFKTNLKKYLTTHETNSHGRMEFPSVSPL